MKNPLELVGDHVVEQAIIEAGHSDDFRLSRALTPLFELAPDTFDRIIEEVRKNLGNAAYRGMIYVETASGGNRVTDTDDNPGEVIPPFRVNITHRHERETHAEPVRKLSYGTLRAIARFPDEPAA